MTDSFWIIVNKKGAVKITKGRRSRYADNHRPALNAGESAVLIQLTIPDSVFAPRALPTATVTVPEHSALEMQAEVTVLDPTEEL